MFSLFLCLYEYLISLMFFPFDHPTWHVGPGPQGQSPVGVLKYRFCYYSGIARPTEPKMTLEKIVTVSGRRGQDGMLGLGQEAEGVQGVGNMDRSLSVRRSILSISSMIFCS